MGYYDKVPVEKWNEITQKLIDEHPLTPGYLEHVVLESWKAILKTKIAGRISIAKDVKPKPQIMGFFLHEVIAFNIGNDLPNDWRKEKSADDKDVVNKANPHFSFEIKTSSNKNKIFGNRSYAQETQSDKKKKSGYYLAVNFERFRDTGFLPRIRLIRFGWIDHEDWLGQAAASGQQARLSIDVETRKLLTIYKIKNALRV
ncbi:MAG: ScaI family restriction endonuclease [Deltaproteobacteria bacterium]